MREVALFRKCVSLKSSLDMLTTPHFIPCQHKGKGCRCLPTHLKKENIYRFHHDDSCWQKENNLGHTHFGGKDGFYRIDRPLFKDECCSSFDGETKNYILKLLHLFNIKCACSTNFTCKVCCSLNCKPGKFNPGLYVDTKTTLDLQTCIALLPYFKYV